MDHHGSSKHLTLFEEITREPRFRNWNGSVPRNRQKRKFDGQKRNSTLISMESIPNNNRDYVGL
jgi:hypothetical protein